MRLVLCLERVLQRERVERLRERECVDASCTRRGVLTAAVPLPLPAAHPALVAVVELVRVRLLPGGRAEHVA